MAEVLADGLGAVVAVGEGRVAGRTPPASFSRALVLAWTGLVGWGDRISSSLLFLGEAVPVSPPLSTLDSDPCDMFRPLPVRRAPGLPAGCILPLSDLAGGPPGLDTEEMDETRAVLDAGIGGGPIDGRLAPPTEGRFAPTEGLTLEGVPVRDVAALEVAVASCFVGDFVGD